MSTIPSTTSGRSVNRSSRPKKSPYWLSSPVNVVLPRLWYIVTSFSHAGDLRFVSAGVEHRVVGERRGGVEAREGVGAGVVAVVERLAARGLVGRGVLRDVRRAVALGVADHVRGVVGDDVEEDLHPAVVRGVDELGEVLVGAEVRVDLGEVGDPVAVVAGRRPVLELDRLVLEDRRQPDRVGAEPLDVVELRPQPVEVATVVEALLGGVEPAHQRVAAEPALVVGRVAVREPVAHHEVEVLVGQARPRRVPRVAAVTVVTGVPVVTVAVVAVACGRCRGGDRRRDAECEDGRNGCGKQTAHGSLPRSGPPALSAR